jgi:hypothetical protein
MKRAIIFYAIPLGILLALVWLGTLEIQAAPRREGVATGRQAGGKCYQCLLKIGVGYMI